jgi:hypothetical protein
VDYPGIVFPPEVPGTAFSVFNNIVRSVQKILLSFERTDDDGPELTTGFDSRLESKSFCRNRSTRRLVPESA